MFPLVVWQSTLKQILIYYGYVEKNAWWYMFGSDWVYALEISVDQGPEVQSANE